ncbi:hypothetical protein AB7849_03845 [Rhodanobacter sp. 115]|uniref:hypothetical protein n=1 Tax=Rhodanobacter sp. FW021-MT20 TaxID=1162282 RepID=UPI0034E39F00
MSETIRANPHGRTYPFRVDGTTPILPIFDQAAVLIYRGFIGFMVRRERGMRDARTSASCWR